LWSYYFVHAAGKRADASAYSANIRQRMRGALRPQRNRLECEAGEMMR